MPFHDAVLDAFARDKDLAGRVRDERKTTLDYHYDRYNRAEAHDGPRIDHLKTQHDDAFAEMGECFERSRAAFDADEHDDAASWSEQGHRLRDEMSRLTEERRRLIADLAPLREDFIEARDAYREAKAHHERARELFNDRLEHCKAEAQRERDKRARERKEQDEQRRTQRATAREGPWHSKYMSSNDSVHLLLDRLGRTTTERPHVHVIHDGRKGYVEIILTLKDGQHPDREFVNLEAGGTVIDAAVERMLAKLPKT